MNSYRKYKEELLAANNTHGAVCLCPLWQEVRWPSVIENWIEPRCVVRRVNVSAKAMLLDAGCYANLEARIGKNQRPRPDGAFFENVAGPPAAGEFHRLVRVRVRVGVGVRVRPPNPLGRVPPPG